MISKYGRLLVAQPLAYLVSWLQITGITPNALTSIGFILTILTAVLLGFGYFLVGGIVLFFAGMFDMLDGSLARATDQSSKFGAFLDSTLDRYSESATFLALAFFYSTEATNRTELVLIFLILVGSLMVSYTRARAEALQIECSAGMLQRPERVLLLIAGLVTGWMLPILWIMAIFTNVSAVQRIHEVYWRLRTQSSAIPGQKMVKPSDNRTF
jgi:CDP-diacylglycerol---glycerol-3-phosphate 3-phosphatidyltransferase